MKKLFMLTSLLALVFSLGSMASNARLSQVDENSISEKFQKLNQLESFVKHHNGVTLSQLRKNNNALVAHVSSHAGIQDVLSTLGLVDFDWGSFMGGVGTGIGICILGCVIIYFAAAFNIINGLKY